MGIKLGTKRYMKHEKKQADGWFRSGLWEKRRNRYAQRWNWRAPLRSVNAGNAHFATEVEWDKFCRSVSLRGELRVLKG